MSKFIDQLKNMTRETTPRIGFRAAVASERQLTMATVVKLPPGRKDITVRMGALGGLEVDAVIIPLAEANTAELEVVSRSSPNLALGVLLEGNNRVKVSQLAPAGVDFVVFGFSTAAPVIESKAIGKVLEVRYDTVVENLRASVELESFIDAVCITGMTGNYISIEHLLAYRRLVRLFRVPLLAEVPAVLSTPELKSVWDAGVDAIIVSDVAGDKAIADIKKMIGNLTREGRRRWGLTQLTSPILPHAGESRVGQEEGEEKEE